MTKTFCDRCKREIAKTKPLFHITIDGQVNGDLCEDCFTDFGKFMDVVPTKIDNYSDPIIHRDSHGIERTTFGSK